MADIDIHPQSHNIDHDYDDHDDDDYDGPSQSQTQFMDGGVGLNSRYGDLMGDENSIVDPSMQQIEQNLLQFNMADGSSPFDQPMSNTLDYPLFKVGEVIGECRGSVTSVRCDRTNGHVYIGSYTGEIILFDFNTHREVWRKLVEVDGRPLPIACLDIRTTLLALGGSDGTTVIFDLETFIVTQVWCDHKQRVSAIAWVGTETKHVYTTSHDGYFLVRDADKKGKILHSFITCTCPLSAMQVESPNIVYIGSWDGQVKKLDLERKQVVLVMKANLTRESPIRCFALALSPATKKKKNAAEEAPVYILFIAHGIGEIKSWDMRTGKVHVESYQGCNDVVNSMTTWNGKLYAAGDDKFVRMFDINSGVCLESLSGHVNGVTSVAICGVTPIVSDEMIESQSASAAATARNTSRKSGRATSAPQQEGTGNELLMTTGFDGQIRAYRLAAIQAAIELKLLKQEEQKQLAFENYVASKTKTKGKKGSKKKGSRKGSAKGDKSSGSKSSSSKTGSAKPKKAASEEKKKKSSKKK